MAQAKQASSSGVMLLVMRWSMQAMATPKPMIPAPPSRISRRMRHSGGWRRSQREQADAAEEQGHGAMGVHDFLAPELMAEVRAEVLEGKHQDVDQVEGDGQQREVGQTREILQGDGKGQGRIHLDGVLDRFERRSGHVLRVRMGAVPSQHSSVATAALSGFPGRSSGLHGRTWRRFHSGSRLASSSATRPSRLQYAASGQGRSNGSRVDAPSPRPISR